MRRFILLAIALSFVSCRSVGEMLRKYGYTEVRPASLLFAPGTLLYVRTAKPFEAGQVCAAEQALGRGFKPRESKTMNIEISKVSKKSLTLQVAVANVVDANSDLHDIRDMKMTLTNASIVEVTDTDVDNYSVYATRSCLRRLAARRKGNFAITMVSSALKADVSYSVTWDKGSKLSADAKIQALANLSGKLNLEGSQVSTNTIHAEGLYWGIRDDQFLAHLFDPDNLPAVDRGSRAFDPNLVANFMGSMDAASSPRTMGVDGDDAWAAEGLPATGPAGNVALLPPAQFTLEPAEDDGDDAEVIKLFP